jgi:hypothetical protein
MQIQIFIPELEFAHMHLRVASINHKPSHEFQLWI